MPFFRKFGYTPNISYLRVFGCLVFVYIPKEKCHRFDTAGELGIFLGFNGTKHAIIYNLIKQRVAEYCHLRFHENCYPGLISSKEQVGQLQDKYFNNPFEDDTFFKTYNHEDHKEESDDETDDENNYSDQMDDLDNETFEPVDMHKPEFITYPDGLPNELINGNDSDADYDEDIELSDPKGEWGYKLRKSLRFTRGIRY
jgi:hypothetical protein